MRKSAYSLLSVATVLVAAQCANAGTITSYGFTRITSNSTIDISSQLSVDVEDLGSGQVSFTFINDVGTASNVAEIYFQDGILGSIVTVDNSGGTTTPTFATSNNLAPGNLPSGNTADPDFLATAAFSVDSDQGGGSSGINESADRVVITFTLLNGMDYDDVISAINLALSDPASIWNADGTKKTDGPDGIRIGLHIRSIAGQSDSYILTGGGGPDLNDVVPEPASMALFGLGALGMGLIARRRRSTNEAAV